MKKLLLHSCCGPCSTSCIDRLKDEYEVTVFYYNPNIYPYEEYLHRLSEQCRYAKECGLKIEVIDGKYDDNEQIYNAFYSLRCRLPFLCYKNM